MAQKLETTEGILPQRQKGYITLRFAPDGKVTAEQMKTLADLSEEEGKGIVLFTMRKTLELPWIRAEKAPEVLEKCEPIYEEYEGWLEDTRRIRSFIKLPRKAKKYLKSIQKILKTKIALISVGQERKQTFICE